MVLERMVQGSASKRRPPCAWSGRALSALVLFLALLVPALAGAGAWTQPPGSFYVKLSFALSNADDQRKGGSTQPLLSFSDRGTVSETMLSLYGEYGLPFDIPGGLTVLASLPYKFLEIDSQRALRRTEGIGDLNLGLRWGLPVDLTPVVLSLQAETKLPTGYTANLPSGEDIPWLGNGVVEVTGSLLAGWSAWPLPVYATVGFGYRWRGDDENQFGAVEYHDELPWSVEVGGTVAGMVLIRGVADGVIATGDTAAIEVAALTPPASNSVRVGGGVIVTLFDLVQLSADYNRVVAGANTALSDQFTIGVAVSH